MKNKFLKYWGVGLFATASLIAVIWASKKYSKKAGEGLAAADRETLTGLLYPVGAYLSQACSISHNAVDIPIPTGTQIKASFDGKVMSVYYTDLGGNQLIMSYPKFNLTIGYAHLSKSLVKVGDAVKKGDIIALSGNTGFSTGSHLHLTAMKNGVRICPSEIFNFKT